MATKPVKLFILLFAISLFSFQNDADARRRGKGLFFITTGDTISNYHKLTAEDVNFLYPGANATKADVAATPGMSVGLRYERFGLFWVNLWTWGGEVVVYEEATKSYSKIVVSQEKALKKYGTPFFYKFPPLLLILIGGGGIWLYIVFGASRNNSRVPKRSAMPSPGLNPGTVPVGGAAPPRQTVPVKKYSDEELQAMYDDPHYQHALDLLEQTDSFIKPIEYLVANGVPETEAGHRLSELKKAIVEAQG